MNDSLFGKTMKNGRKQIHQICNNKKEKKLFGVKTKSP